MLIPFSSPIALFLALVFAHCLADYPLQGDFLARAKNHMNQFGAPVDVPWAIALAVHAFIHAGFVAYLTHSLAFGAAEFVVHCITDYMKNDGKLGTGEGAFARDQLLHVAHKAMWAIAVWGLR